MKNPPFTDADLQDTGYKRAIITWLDIFGFGQFVRFHRKDSATPKAVLDVMSRMLAPDDLQRVWLGFVACSDSVLRVSYLEHCGQELTRKHVRQEMHEVARIQRALVLNKRPWAVRGAITVGGISFHSTGLRDERIIPADLKRPAVDVRIYGPGLVEAVRLESKKAEWPRVMVARRALRLVDPSLQHEEKTDVTEEFLKQEPKLVATRGDGLSFVNYLAGFGLRFERDPKVEEPLCFGNPTNYLAFLNSHRNLIRHLAKKAKNDEERQRIQRLADYHNSVVETIDDAALERSYSGQYTKQALTWH
jgi:hypothetical protein